MNEKLGKVGAAITGLSVFAFAISMLIGFFTPTLFSSYLSSIGIALGFVVMVAALAGANDDAQARGVGVGGVVFAAIYAMLILLVYYAQSTTVRMNPALSEEALSLLDYSRAGSLLFNYDLLGYGMMAISTFLIGFTVRPIHRCARALRIMLWLHGLFFLPCFIMPMLPVFTAGSDTTFSVIMLECWCGYFIPLCVLAYRYFRDVARVER